MLCGDTLCGRYDRQHALVHFESSITARHCLMINTESLATWCYGCDKSVEANDRTNTEIREARKILEENLFVDDVVAAGTEAVSDSQSVPEASIASSAKSKGNWRANYNVLSPGLTNLGNTCYFNSSMQCLAVIRLLHDSIMPSDEAYVEPMIPFRLKKDFDTRPLVSSFIKLMYDVYTNTKSGSHLSPKHLFAEIRRHHGQFTVSQQMDAHELLRLHIASMRLEELGKSDTAKPGAQRRRLSRKHVTAREDFRLEDGLVFDVPPTEPSTVWDYALGGALASVVVCDTCKSITTVREEYMDLSLPIYQPPTIRKRDRLRNALLRTSESSLTEPTRPVQQSRPRSRTAHNSSGADADGADGAASVAPSDSGAENDDVDTGTPARQNSVLRRHLEKLSLSAVTSSSSLTDDGGGMSSSQAGRGGVESGKSFLSPTKGEPNLPPVASEEKLDYIDKLLEHRYPRPPVGTRDITIEDCLFQFTNTEILDEHNAFACEQCAKILNDSARAERDEANASKMGQSGSRRPDRDDVGKTDRSESSDDGTPVNTQATSSAIEDDDNDDDETGTETRVNRSSSASSFGSLRQKLRIPWMTSAGSLDDRKDSASSSVAANEAGEYKPVRFLYRRAFKRYFLHEPIPRTLMLHIKRFQQVQSSGTLRKIDTPVRFGEILDVTPFIEPVYADRLVRENGGPITFRLIGVLVHMGSFFGGHYVSYTLTNRVQLNPAKGKKGVGVESDPEQVGGKTAEGRRWMFASDKKTRPASFEEVQKARAYILLYERAS